MTEPVKKKVSGPFIAIGLIAVIWIALQLRPAPKDDVPAAVSNSTESTGTASTSNVSAPITVDANSARVVEPEAEYVVEGGSWSTFHGGPALTGTVADTLPAAPELRWRFQADASVYYPPVTSEGRIYFNTLKGGVYALDFDGNEIWTKQFFQEPHRDGRPRPERFDAPISCFDSTVLLGSMRGLVYAFDGATGDTKWTYDLGGPVLGTINLHDPSDAPGDERVFIIDQSEGVLHCVELATGTLLWKTDPVERCDGSPSIKGDVIVYGSCAAALHVFSATTGDLLKDIPFDEDSQVAGGAAIVGESAFVGSHSGRFFRTDLNAGTVVWYNEDSLDEIFETPAVDENYVVFGSYDGNVYALYRETGERVWTFETDGVPTSPVIAANTVLITSDGILHLLDIDSGEEVWSQEISDEVSSPAIINGMIVVSSDDGTVSAYGAPKLTEAE